MATPKLESYFVDEIEGAADEATERELTTAEIGEMIMRGLKKLDKLAYVRFASVYMDFKDVQEFMSGTEGLVERSHQEVEGTGLLPLEINGSGDGNLRACGRRLSARATHKENESLIDAGENSRPCEIPLQQITGEEFHMGRAKFLGVDERFIFLVRLRAQISAARKHANSRRHCH